MINIRANTIKQQRIGVVVLLCLILLVELVFHWDVFFESKEVKYSELPLSLTEATKIPSKTLNTGKVLYFFNPNALSKVEWQKLGFSEKQVEVIFKYKQQLPKGVFSTKQQIKKCYVISAKKFEELEPYIVITENKRSNEVLTTPVVVKNTDLNTATFTEIYKITQNKELASRILNFRKGLGGFVSKEQLKDIYNIDEKITQKLVEHFILDSSQVQKIDIKKATEEELQNHIYFRKYKNRIIKAQEIGEYPLRVIPKSDPKYKYILKYLKE